MRLGIDFGTTRTVVACADRGNYPVLSFIDDAGDSHDWIPSVVADHKGKLLFGFDALATGDRSCVVRSFKRLLSGTDATPGREVMIGSVVIGIDDLVTRFLAHVRDAVLERSTLAEEAKKSKGKKGAAASSKDIDSSSSSSSFRSVVAVPANASGAQRFLTLDAFRRAELEPIAMLNEPSAAGFEYTHRHRDTLTSKRDHVVVYDLGGGTFDASLVRMRGTSHEVLATAGVNELGGDDFDTAILEVLLAKTKLNAKSLDPATLTRLRDECRDAKERLNPSSKKMSIDLEAALGKDAPSSEIAIPVAEIYEACAPLVERSIEAMIPVMARLDGDEGVSSQHGAPPQTPPHSEHSLREHSTPLRGRGDPSNTPTPASVALGDGEIAVRDDIAGIYVVGGASELPIVGRLLRQRFGRRVHRSPYASGAIAIGLAIACDEKASFELVDRFSRTFGVFREGHDGTEITFDPIFTRETVLPTTASGPLAFRRRYRAAHNVGHFRFLECSSMTDDGRPRGHMVFSGDVLFPFEQELTNTRDDRDLKGIRVERMDQSRGPTIEEEYLLDEHGIVAVTIKNIDAGFERVFQLGA